MKLALCALSLALPAVAALGQAPAGGPPEPKTAAGDLGFTFALPSGWQVVESPSHSPAPSPPPGSAGNAVVKGIACLKVPLTAQQGDPRSVLVEATLPFECFGQTIAPSQLPDFASGAVGEMKQSFDIDAPVESTYTLGTHPFWIQRAKGNTKGQIGTPYTFEIACGLLRKAAVCWMVAAAGEAALDAFEHAAVTLDGDPPTALVPASIFP
jgi:hypothetical protein